MDRNYIIYNNHHFTLIWHLAFGNYELCMLVQIDHEITFAIC